ncbi:hypothetical protein BX666DRAFT_2113713 [Dichotomocladium elegans]|nr:hypothetical protein BX666DRAFT_2113713 [Dichotomocladium elegans]
MTFHAMANDVELCIAITAASRCWLRRRYPGIKSALEITERIIVSSEDSVSWWFIDIFVNIKIARYPVHTPHTQRPSSMDDDRREVQRRKVFIVRCYTVLYLEWYFHSSVTYAGY